ncbi:hypothetical protein [Bordetella sp. FB-8]|uniref:hypothetical protein n=1 Tax=Bordetella sp. FB-8 TaxID=1159870 RepID=UPI00039B7F48|nr:hypothetical protein [Bordetella sp. FB-8]
MNALYDVPLSSHGGLEERIAQAIPRFPTHDDACFASYSYDGGKLSRTSSPYRAH